MNFRHYDYFMRFVKLTSFLKIPRDKCPDVKEIHSINANVCNV